MEGFRDSPGRLSADTRRYLEQFLEEGIDWIPGTSRPARLPLAPGPDAPPPPAADETESKRQAYRALRVRVLQCRGCRLGETRTHAVLGEGKMLQGVIFIGEGPGAKEDKTGRPFVGPAGELLNKMLASIGLTRSDIYITNIVKCRPPGNRDPNPDEITACWPHLEAQLKLLQPRLIVTLGSPATKTMLETSQGIGRLRGHLHDYQGIPLLPFYHPAYILRSYTEENRRKAYDDLKLLRSFLDGKGPRAPGN